MKIWVAEIVGYDPSLPGTRTLYYSTKGFTSLPTDTPANTYFAGRLKQPSILKRDMFDSGTTFGRSRASYGDIVLANDDGTLDVLIPYGFDGRSITMYCGEAGADYPADFELCVVTTAEQVTFGVTELTFKLRGREFELEQPIQSTKYAGDNSLPDGLEGSTDLAGKPKPFSFGKVFNAPAVLVNSAKLIYQVHDGAITEITDVRDRGISLNTGTSDWGNPTSGFGASAIYTTIFAEGLFVNGGAGGQLYTSPDGSNWTSRTSGFGTEDIMAIGYGNGIFVAVGTSSYTSTSTDGMTWVARTPASGGATLRVVYYSADQFRWVTAGDANLTYYSNDDAVTWVNTSNSFSGGIYAGSYAVVAGLPTYVLAGQSGELETSNDGKTWTARTSGFGSGSINRVVRAPNLFFAAGANNSLYVSPDGVTWSPRFASFASTVTIRDVFYADGVYIIAGDGGVLATSSDGIIFDNQTSRVSPTYLYQASRGVGLFVVVGTGGTVITSAPSGGDYGSLAALQDDTQEPASGAYFTYLAGGYFRLGSSPAGIVTCDYQVQATLPACSAAAGFEAVMAKMGKSSGTHYSAADVAALDVTNPAPLGYFSDTQNVNANTILDEIAGSVGAWWGTDKSGIYRIKVGPNPTGTSVYTITTAVIIRNSLVRLPTNDMGRGLPTFCYNVGYQKNYTVQTTDLAFGVSDEDRTLYEHGWLNESATVASIQTLHTLSIEGRDNTLLVRANDAHGEAFRRLSLYSGERSRYEMTIVLDDTTQTLEMGDTVTLTYPRFGLDAGVKMAIVMLEPNHGNGTLRIGLWGGGTYSKYVPIYAVTGAGAARVLR